MVKQFLKKEMSYDTPCFSRTPFIFKDQTFCLPFSIKTTMCLLSLIVVAFAWSPFSFAGEADGIQMRVETLETEMKENLKELQSLKKSIANENKTNPAEKSELFAIFGNFRGSVNKVNDPLCQGTCAKDNTQDGVSIRNNASVLGFRGEMKRNRLTAFYKHLLRSHNDEIFSPGSLQTLYYYAGIKGRLGNLKGGTLPTPYKLPALAIDPFYDTSGAARGFDGNSFGLSQLSLGFTKNAIALKSAALFGVTVDAALIIDDTNADDHDYNAGLQFKKGAFSTGLQHLSLQPSKAVAKSTGEGNATRFWFSYQTKKWSLAGSGEKIFIKGANNEEHYFLAGTITPMPALKLAATLGKSNVLDNPVFDGKGSSVGFFYTLVPKFQIFGLFSKVFRDAGREDREVFSLGMIYNFGWSHRR